jgi:vacuolar-type H+-ATPase subunit E/Vma4
MNSGTTELAPQNVAPPAVVLDDRARPVTTCSDEGAADQVAALCQRLREIARQSGEATLQAKQQEAEQIIADARRLAASEAQSAIEQARARLSRKRERSLQIARLKACARIAQHRWQELNSVLDRAADAVRQLRHREPARYTAALVRSLRQAVGQVSNLVAIDPSLAPTVGCKPDQQVRDCVVLRMNPHDIPLIRTALARDSCEQLPGDGLQFVECDIDAGLVVTFLGGSVCVDESLTERLHRLDCELRLAAQEILFA